MPSLTFAYARVSKQDQNDELQLDDLKKHGYDRLFSEKVSGAAKERPAFAEMMKMIRPGDKLVVWDVDRMGRNLVEQIQTIDFIFDQKIEFKSLSQPFIDTTNESSEFVFKLFALLAETERKRNSRRTKAGLAAGRARGRVGGRPKGLSKAADLKANYAKMLYEQGKTQAVIMEQLGIKSTETLYRWLRIKGAQIGGDKAGE